MPGTDHVPSSFDAYKTETPGQKKTNIGEKYIIHINRGPQAERWKYTANPPISLNELEKNQYKSQNTKTDSQRGDMLTVGYKIK